MTSPNERSEPLRAKHPESGRATGARAQKKGKQALLFSTIAAVALLGIAGFAVFSGGLSSGGAELITFTVRPTRLPINVIERGNLESQNEVSVFCEVDDIEGDSIQGTPILWIIGNGSSVQQGELLVELDASGHKERLDRQVLDTERARSEQIQAQVKYENQKTQNLTSAAEADLKVELAELALKQYEDEDGGTFQIDLQDIELQIQEAQASRLIEETNLAGVEQLYKLGYRSTGELAQARLSALKSERALATSISRRKELVEYQYRKSKLELEGAVASAKRSREQVLRDNEAILTQAKASTDAADEQLKKEEERLARYTEHVAQCKIYAPSEGMVAYAVDGSPWRREEIREGANIRPRQRLLSIPNLKKMQVKTAVHESVLDQISVGLPATVRVDAFPDRSYPATVQSVAVLPDQDTWMSSDTKVYRTVVSIDEDVEQLKPGMTAVVEIHVADLQNVIAVPVQAIRQVRGKSWCHVGADGAERRDVKLGRSNDKFVEVVDGLRAGDLVVLNPDAIFDDSSLSGPQMPAADAGVDPRAPRPERPPEAAAAAGAGEVANPGADGRRPSFSGGVSGEPNRGRMMPGGFPGSVPGGMRPPREGGGRGDRERGERGDRGERTGERGGERGIGERGSGAGAGAGSGERGTGGARRRSDD